MDDGLVPVLMGSLFPTGFSRLYGAGRAIQLPVRVLLYHGAARGATGIFFMFLNMVVFLLPF